MANKTFKMTQQSYDELKKKRDYLKTEGRDDIAEKLKIARSYGDLSENSEYDEAKSEQAKLEAQIAEYEYMLDNAEIIESGSSDTVSMGTKVTAIRKLDGEKIEIEIVSLTQVDPANGKISEDSPIGKALVGAKIGDTVVVEAPIGNLELDILSIQ